MAFMGIVCSVPEDVDSASTNLISTIGYDAPLRPAQLRDPPDYSDGQSRPWAIKRYLAAVEFTCRIRASGENDTLGSYSLIPIMNPLSTSSSTLRSAAPACSCPVLHDGHSGAGPNPLVSSPAELRYMAKPAYRRGVVWVGVKRAFRRSG